MAHYENNPEYMALIAQMKDAVVAGAEADGNPLGAIMLMSDVTAEVILTALPREQWMPALDLLLTRLGNTMDRRAAAGCN